MNIKPEENILLRYKEGIATPEEIKLVEDWILVGLDLGLDLTEVEVSADLANIQDTLNLNRPKRNKLLIFKRVAVAASIIIVATLSINNFLPQSKIVETVALKTIEKNYGDNVGGNLATLTLSDGSKIRLDASVRKIAGESGIEIANDSSGNVTYFVKNVEEKDLKTAYNTITTPTGGTYKIVLPDGSKVWLNAMSSLRFPVSFSNDTREVELTGEGYFEVSKSSKKFNVLTNKTLVQVLGTHFNINGYANEGSTSVTLLEGSVQVTANNDKLLLTPGNQAQVLPNATGIALKNDVNTESLVAWKDGKFKYYNTDLKTIMRQLERWYDVDVIESAIPNKNFNGTISRDAKLSEILLMIELTSKVSFRIEGRRITMK